MTRDQALEILDSLTDMLWDLLPTDRYEIEVDSQYFDLRSAIEEEFDE